MAVRCQRVDSLPPEKRSMPQFPPLRRTAVLMVRARDVHVRVPAIRYVACVGRVACAATVLSSIVFAVLFVPLSGSHIGSHALAHADEKATPPGVGSKPPTGTEAEGRPADPTGDPLPERALLRM